MLSKPRCLVVDDEPDILELLSITIEKMGIHTDCAETLEEAQFCLGRHHYDLCLTDMRLPDGNGLDLMKYINLHHSGLPIAVMTAFGSADNAVSALKSGAVEYLNKPVSVNQLRPLVANAIRPYQYGLHKDNQLTLIGKSELINQVRNAIDTFSQSDANVLIMGEPGTGKELAARLIHLNSCRRNQKFVKVNCNSINERNAKANFLSQSKQNENSTKKVKLGFLEEARNGTLFLDQVDKLSPSVQSLLFEEMRDNPLNIRLICSTQRDIRSLLEQERFSHEFNFFIHVLALHMPALRNIPEDLPLLVHHLLKTIKPLEESTPCLSACALAKIRASHLQGNLSELKNILEKALATHAVPIIKAEQLVIKDKPSITEETNLEVSKMPLPDYLEHVERQVILKALNQTQQNKTAAAKLLGVSFRTLRYRLSKLGLSQKL